MCGRVGISGAFLGYCGEVWGFFLCVLVWQRLGVAFQVAGALAQTHLSLIPISIKTVHLRGLFARTSLLLSGRVSLNFPVLLSSCLFDCDFAFALHITDQVHLCPSMLISSSRVSATSLLPSLWLQHLPGAVSFILHHRAATCAPATKCHHRSSLI